MLYFLYGLTTMYGFIAKKSKYMWIFILVLFCFLAINLIFIDSLSEASFLKCCNVTVLLEFSSAVAHLKFSNLLSEVIVLMWSTKGLFSGLGINASARSRCK